MAEIAALEKTVSEKAGKERTMFNPEARKGASGIHEVIRWSKAEYGKYRGSMGDLQSLDDGTGEDCVDGWCRT